MKLSRPALALLLQRAYSGEMAAAFAYVGHAGSLRCPQAKAAVKQIEDDEWHHRANVLSLNRLLPLFQRIFAWGQNETANDVDLANPSPVPESHRYCKTYKAHGHTKAANFGFPNPRKEESNLD
jgi:hypothetical protein